MTTHERTPEEKENNLIYHTDKFRAYACPRGYLDCKEAVRFADEFDYDEAELFDIIDERLESCGMEEQYSKVDPVSIIYDHVLQQARNDIDDKVGVDIMNDYCFDTYGNYMATSYDRKEDDAESLEKDLEGHRDDLEEDTIKRLAYVEIYPPKQDEDA